MGLKELSAAARGDRIGGSFSALYTPKATLYHREGRCRERMDEKRAEERRRQAVHNLIIIN